VQCTTDASCSAPTPLCGDQGRCVQCRNDKNCPTATPNCDNGTCVK
jgi:hypothetical protein